MGQVAVDGGALMEQLEFDLWVEERITLADQMRSRGRSVLAERALIYGQSEAFLYNDPISMDIIVRYRL